MNREERSLLLAGMQVAHPRHGLGKVEFDKGPTTIVRFDAILQEVERQLLTVVDSPLTAVCRAPWHEPLQVTARVQAEAIRSVNDTWGVFSRSRIALLPHQLWVCRRVLEKWPARWLVADDVGLGKTIEAGLILWPLISRGTVRRLLILCPASLVEQWQFRMRTMFDIRVAQYVTEQDTKRTDFWNTYPQAVASLETVRSDGNGRHQRMLEAEPWDLLIVDEAHRLNADEQEGPTLGYKLIQQLTAAGKLAAMVFFTGTPHRGKNYNFLALLRLLRPELFDPKRSLKEHLPLLRQVMIRNNKQDATDLQGKKLFQPPLVESATYGYSPEEDYFYSKLTIFIETGQAYASKLNENDGRAVMLVLIAMQKLASSSIAAIGRALRGRLSRLSADRTRRDELRQQRDGDFGTYARNYQAAESEGDTDVLNVLDERIAELDARLALMENEAPRIEELIQAADAVGNETKIEEIIQALRGRFADRSVLFFTEYKATQSLVMSKLQEHFGDDCVTFINGDERADGVVDAQGRARTITETRVLAAERFNAGQVRFLVSTEAGGEGIDLQESCHTLIHVDLPWNPMRLHQRVGRLNRYGQTRRVEVLTLRNPHTVESRIWEQLNAKLALIQQAFTGVMDQPEDILQLVLGMTSPTLFRELFSEAAAVPNGSVSQWFDQKTARFGGRDVIETVKELVGNCARFDFQQVSSQLPQVDLPALRPFCTAMLTLNRRKFRDDPEGLAFKTPEAWLTEAGTRTDYEGMIFDRRDRSRDASQRILGVGHKVIDAAMRQARQWTCCVAAMPRDIMDEPLHVFRIHDRVTDGSGNVRMVLAGILGTGDGSRVLRDWELLELLNRVPVGRTKLIEPSSPCVDPATAQRLAEQAMETLRSGWGVLDMPFQYPEPELLACFLVADAE